MRLAAQWLPLADAVGVWLSTYLLHSTFLLLAALGLARWLGSRQLPLQESLLRVAVVGGLLTATLQVGLGWEPAVGSIPYPVSPPSAWNAPGAEAASLGPSELGSGPGTSQEGPIAGERPGAPVLAATRGVSGGSWLWLVVVLWVVGGVLATGRLLLLAAALGRRLRDRVPIERGMVFRLFWRLLAAADIDRPTRLSHCARLRVPIALGLTGREVCLPPRVLRQLPREQLETVLAHELAHLERRDPIWLLVMRSIECLLFVQPLNRLARRRLQELAEYGCDDWAARHTGRPDTLARCLTEVATWSVEEARLALAPTMASRSGLGRRVRRLLAPGYTGAPARLPGWWRPLAGAALLCVVLAVPGFSALELEQAPEPPQAPEPIEAFHDLGEVPEPAAAVAAPSPGGEPATTLVAPSSPVGPPVPVVAPEPTPRPHTVEPVEVVTHPRSAPRIVHRARRREVVRIAPRVGGVVVAAPLVGPVLAADGRGGDETSAGPALDCEELEVLEDELDGALDDLEASLEGDLEAMLEDLDDEQDALDDRLEESLEGQLGDFESEMDRELESVEDELDRLEERLDASASERSDIRFETEMERVEDDMDGLSDEVDRELDRIERRFERRLEAGADDTAVRELEARVEQMTARIERQSASLEAMARRMVRERRAAGETRLGEGEREALRAEARRLAAAARPSEDEVEALRLAARELEQELQPSVEELEAMRREVERELDALRERVARRVAEERRTVQRLEIQGADD